MSRWVIGIGALVVVCLVASFIALNDYVDLSDDLPGVSLVPGNGRRTWIVREEGATVALPGEVRPDDALVCVLDGPDARVERLTDLYTRQVSDPRRMIWIESDGVENSLAGEAGSIFDRDPMGTVLITCGVGHID